MNKKEFKILLNKLLSKELEDLRKKFRPYKRRSFLNHKVTIKIDNKYCKKRCLAYYDNNRKDERQREYKHEIFMTKLAIEDYEMYVKLKWKRMGISKLKQIIRHELVHAFVFEEFEEWGDIKDSYGDYSPIFLSCLYWSEGSSGHSNVNKFKKTDLYKKIEKCKKYDQVITQLINYTFELEHTVRIINQNIMKNIQEYKELKIEFNRYGAGIVKKKYISLQVTGIKDNRIYIQKYAEMTLGLGFLVTPQILMENYQRKFDNGTEAKIHSEMIAYTVNNELKQKRIII